jgi:hypothetical protein
MVPLTRTLAMALTQPKPLLVDTIQAAANLVQRLQVLPDRKLYFDLEGISLGRNGRVCIGQVTWPNSDSVYLLDFVAMPKVLEARDSGCSLRDVLVGVWTAPAEVVLPAPLWQEGPLLPDA